jgi:Recombination endonuclease VII
MKKCKVCGENKGLENFRIVKTNKNGTYCYKSHCTDCYNKHYREKYHDLNDQEKVVRRQKSFMGYEYHKNYKLVKNYGISLEIYNEMYEKQSGKCYICDKKIYGNDVKVDHDHETNVVRKLLCHNCNTSLGLLKEDINLFYKCIEYLREHKHNGNIS